MIKRDKYLKRLESAMWNDSIKVITGIRRSGKSYLINTIFYNFLISNGIPKENIIKFAFDSADDLKLIGEDLVELETEKRNVSYKKFCEYISSIVSNDEKYYLLLDEVQRLESFEFVLNGYLTKGNIDVYVTGSNSKFLSSDVITEFRGRGDEIHILPLSFSEYYDYARHDNKMEGSEKRSDDLLLDEYMTYGGLPRVALTESLEEKSGYLKSQMENTYIRDVMERHDLKRSDELEELVDIISSGISTLTNPSKLENRFKSEKKITFSAETISRYIGFLEDSFIIKKSIRYDVKGKAYISTPFKIYFEDIGLRNARIDFRQIEYTHIMENVIFNELRYRGFSVDVGVVPVREKNASKQLEVDFIANLGSNRFYIQSAFDVTNPEKYESEVRPFDNIPDSFKKILIVRNDIVPKHSEKGYLIISLKDFLCNTDSINW